MKCATCNHLLTETDTACPVCGTSVNREGPKTAISLKARPLEREEQPVQPLRVNDLLSGRYRLEAKIGEGGMGVVYSGADVELDRKIAVKLLAPSMVNEPEVIERFEREARLTAGLDHPNIVPIYDVGRHEGRPFIVMKLLQGDTLAGVLRAKGGLSSDETVALMKQIAAGLDYIHKQGFIHRDIKAGNIFVAPNGHATILDFGILRSRDTSKGLTRTGMVMGTPHYMAPEQALGLKDLDHRVDLYALAVVLFECLTGTLPFEADSELRLIQLHAHAPPPEILERAPWISKPVADVMRKALAKKPGDRFSSAAELVSALESAYRASKGHAAAPVRAGSAAGVSLSARNAEGARELDDVIGELPTPRRRAVWLASAAVALTVAAAALWVVKPGVRDGQVETPSAPAFVDAGVQLAVDDGKRDAGWPAVLAIAGLDAGERESDDEDDAGVAAAMNEPADAGKRVMVVSTSRRKGSLRVLSQHLGEPYWSSVSIDGVAKGRTPFSIELAPGRYTVRVERAGFRTQQRAVRVTPGTMSSVRFDLAP